MPAVNKKKQKYFLLKCGYGAATKVGQNIFIELFFYFQPTMQYQDNATVQKELNYLEGS